MNCHRYSKKMSLTSIEKKEVYLPPRLQSSKNSIELLDQAQTHGKTTPLDNYSERKRKREETFPLFTVIIDHIEPFVLHLAFSLVFSGLARAVEMFYPLYIAISLDTIRGRPPGWILHLVNTEREVSYTVAILTIILVLIYILQSALNWVYQRVSTTLGEGLQHSIRMELYGKLQIREMALLTGLPQSKKRMQELLLDDCEQLETLLLKGLSQFSQLVASIGVGLVFMIFINWKMTIVSLSPLFFILLISGLYWYKVDRMETTSQKPQELLEARMNNSLGRGFVPMKTHNMNISEYNRVAAVARVLKSDREKFLTAQGRFPSLVKLIMLIGLAGVVAIGSYWLLTDSDELSTGYYIFFLLIVPMIIFPVSRLGETLQLYRRTLLSVTRMLAFLRAMPNVRNPTKPQVLPSQAAVVLNGVHYVSRRYDEKTYLMAKEQSGAQRLCDVTVTIPPQSVVAFTGDSESGLECIAPLLVRLYDPSEGTIQLGEVNYRAANIHDLHTHITLVPRDPYIFEASVAENINYGSVESLHQSEVLQEVSRVASQALLDPLLERLPHGIQSILTEKGTNLTLGERQLISIARALRQNTEIIVLEDVTSLVDWHTDGLILSHFREIFAGKTVIICSSKLSLVRQADHIFVLQRGRLAESGNHQELIDREQVYTNMWNVYSGLIRAP